MSEPFFKTDCPSCGAPVHAHSATAVTLVCGYCNSMLVRQDHTLIDTGRDSALLEDFSPLQIGVRGRFATQSFTLVGRLQARYDAGVWNEWYALFDDGGTGWLSEAGDIYVMTRPTQQLPNHIPQFQDIRAGFSQLDYQNRKFIAADIRNITLKEAAAQGELPFQLHGEMPNQVADWRCENMFLTLDYATQPPEVFLGTTVKLADLKLENLRTDAQIQESAGRLKGTRQSENCPHCGSPIQWVSGMTHTVICPSCASELDTSKEQAQLIQANSRRKAQDQSFTLPLGAQGKINQKTYIVMGVVRKEEWDAQDTFDAMYSKRRSGIVPESSWVEYLLYSPQAGFLWLVETEDNEWAISETLTDWPRLDRNGAPQGCPKLYDYGGHVAYAAGAFYWHIRQGDLNYYSDYKQGHNKICSELSVNELAWSKSEPVSYRKIAEWFDLKSSAGKPVASGEYPSGLSKFMAGLFIFLNFPAWFAMDWGDLVFSLILTYFAVRFLYNPSSFLSKD